MAEALAAAFCYDRLVLATTTYNAGIYPFMREFIQQLTEHGFQNRTVALIENGSWAPMAAKEMKTMLESCKNLTIAQTIVQIRSALQEESLAQLQALAEELTARQDEAQVTIEPEADNSTKKKLSLIHI